jgi:hypothetical protein
VYYAPNRDHSSKKKRNPYYRVKYTSIHHNILLSKHALSEEELLDDSTNGEVGDQLRAEEALTGYGADSTPSLHPLFDGRAIISLPRGYR